MPNSQITNPKKFDIYERIFDLIVVVLKLLERLPKTSTNITIISQLTRSITSMGANSQEADGAFSLKDFLHCYTIVRKESKESLFWMKLINATNPKFQEESLVLEKEIEEIVRIVSTIIIKSKKAK